MKNCCRVKIEGVNLLRLIDALVSRSVCVFDLKIRNTKLIFSIYEKDIDCLKEICRKENKTFEVVFNFGLKKFLSKLKCGVGFTLAFVIVFSYLFSFCKVIQSVNVVCDDKTFDVLNVEKVLANYGIKNGEFVKYSNAEIEKIVTENIDDVFGCSVSKIGSKINVEIYLEKQKEEKQKTIYSKYDAVVTKVESFSGELKVKIGDVVKVGDVLIDSDFVASGKVKGKVCFVATRIYNENQTVVEKTGKFKRVVNYKICKKYFYKTQKMINYSTYIKEKCDFYIFDNFLLPIVCEEIYCFETRFVDVVVPFEQVEEKIKKELLDEVCEKVDEDCVLSKTFSIVCDGSYTRVDCFVEAEIMLF